MSLRLYYNKSNGIFSVRNVERSTVAATEKRSVYRKLPLIGTTFSLSPVVHAVVTRGAYNAATKGKRPFVPVKVTKFPMLHLLWLRVKEVF